MPQGHLVSAVCPTRASRIEYLPTAIRCFQNQTYQHRELVIVSEDDVTAVIPSDTRIRLLRCPPGLTLGLKRTIGAEAASGDVVAHWDDDDLYHPARLSEQQAILTPDKPITGYRSIRFYSVVDGHARAYHYHDDALVLGTSITYRRSVLTEHPYPDLTHGDECIWLAGLGSLLTATDGLDRCIALDHDGNTCPRIYTTSYSAIDRAETLGLMQEWSSPK
ncbi:glycosyltransferase family 2 protein [Paludibaculum fermentans]|uniref:glycosyltransferase family 2 protein n=1 Tax=Paludibaculum fermentans TaxID=1473598 RepID=UPI003EB72A0D